MMLFEALNATQMEKAIVNGLNGDEVNPEATGVVEYLQELGLTGSAKHVGSAQYNPTIEWAKYNPGKSRPKTDFIVNGYKISLKTGDKYTFSNINKNESLALFNTVAQEANLIKSKMVGEIISNLQDFALSGLSNERVGKAKKTDITMQKAEKTHETIRQNLEELFANNTSFKKKIIQELLTGNLKFGVDSEASATHFLTMGSEDLELLPINTKLINLVASKTNIEVSFTTRAARGSGMLGKYYYWSTIKLYVQHLFEQTNDFNTLDESMVSYIQNLIGILKSVLTSIPAMLDFMGLEVEIKISE